MSIMPPRIEPDSILDSYAHAVVKAAFEVHRHLGPGFQESVYEEALAQELSARSIPFERQLLVHVHYKNAVVGQTRLDLLVAGKLIVELKAQELILPVHLAQVVSYLCATRQPLGLLINFNVRNLSQGIRRIISAHQ